MLLQLILQDVYLCGKEITASVLERNLSEMRLYTIVSHLFSSAKTDTRFVKN
jgi:hypothetical protein